MYSRLCLLTGVVAPPTPPDPDATAYLDVLGITDPVVRNAVNTAVIVWKDAGIYDQAVAFYLLLGDTEAQRAYNLKDPRPLPEAYYLNFVGPWEHTVTGSKPDGLSCYADTFINLNEDVPQYSFHGSYYARENVVPVEDYSYFGVRGTDNGIIDLSPFFTDRLYGAPGDAPDGAINLIGFSDFDELMGMSLYHAVPFNMYRNSDLIASNTITKWGYFGARNPDDIQTLALAAFNDDGTRNKFCSAECAFASFGAGLSPGQWNVFNSSVTDLLTTLGRAL